MTYTQTAPGGATRVFETFIDDAGSTWLIIIEGEDRHEMCLKPSDVMGLGRILGFGR
jgi:hypothetical protein